MGPGLPVTGFNKKTLQVGTEPALGARTTSAFVCCTLASLGLTICLTACGTKEPQDWVARVESFSGTVRVMKRENSPDLPAEKGGFLHVGGRLTTRERSEAILALRNGGKLTVKPNSMVILRSSLPSTQLNLTLAKGSVVGESSAVEASELMINVGKQKIKLGSSALATISASSVDAKPSKVVVSYGQASIEGPRGEIQTIEAGSDLVLTSKQPDAKLPPKPDGGPPTVTSDEVLFFLQATGTGSILIKKPDSQKFMRIRQGQVVAIPPGTVVKLLARATMLIGTEKGKGTFISGPAQLVVQQAPSRSSTVEPDLQLMTEGSRVQINTQGKQGKAGPSFAIQGVQIHTSITYDRLNIKVHHNRGPVTIEVNAGKATLQSKQRTVLVEAGQEAVISRGKIAGPSGPPLAPLQIRHEGTTRVFATSMAFPVTIHWKLPEGARGSLVKVARNPAMAQPLFADVIQRQTLTLPQLRQGSYYWRVTPQLPTGASGTPLSGKIAILKDTSFRQLKNQQAHRNTIHQKDGNTRVYYQNTLPQFTLRWNPIEDTSTYKITIYREQNLDRPVYQTHSRPTSLQVPPGKLTEGSYLWYIAARSAQGALLKATQSHKLTIIFDNANPDLQIIYPPNNFVAAQSSLAVKGITFMGSSLSINGERIELDSASRFTHTVSLKKGINFIVFLVRDRRRGSSYYLRQITLK